MSGEWTLPLVQDRLDDLAPGQEFTLTKDDFVRLFGLNDAAVQRIRRFAESHRCHTLFDGRQLIFRKNCLSNGPV
jgi:hypothetical protein